MTFFEFFLRKKFTVLKFMQNNHISTHSPWSLHHCAHSLLAAPLPLWPLQFASLCPLGPSKMLQHSLAIPLAFCQAPRRARWMLWPLERDRSWVRKWASRFAIACSRLHVRDFFFKFSMTFFWKNGNFHLIIADQKLWNGKIIFTALTAPPLVLFLHFFPIFFFNFLFFRRFFRFLPWFFPF